MNGKNEAGVSFETQSKETVQDRLRQLIGRRSLRAVATAWNLPYSTLNNYLSRGTEPSLKAMQQVAEAEGVSLDWLASGCNREQINSTLATDSIISATEAVIESNQALRTIWAAIFESLPASDIEALIKLIHRKGIEAILSMGGNVPERDSRQQALTPQMKQIIELLETCDDTQLREILQGIAGLKSTTLPGAESVSQVSKKAG